MSERKDYIAGLRQLADYLENNPDIPTPSSTTVTACATDYLNEEGTKHNMQAVAKCPGPWSKEFDDSFLTLTRKFAGIELQVFCNRNHVCKMVEPAKPAVWDCEPLLSAKEFEELTA